MQPKRRIFLLVFLLLISIWNYSRIPGIENIRTVEFLSIFIIGALSGILLSEVATALRNKWLV